ncbi:MAG TPA: class II aldolase/adducin family protein [Gammaproteobacteria bacterium]|nr:class II aldolase/adducin family protein [Gammaproteobacteria bacterium]
MDEGVIKFQLQFTPGSLPDGLPLAELIAWQRIMQKLGLLGRDPDRYGGLAYGNLSLRLENNGFVISASQCADRPRPTAKDYCLVTAWDCARNRLVAQGPAHPSSESLTHAALYDAEPTIGCIIHGHSPEIWQRREALRLASTRPEVAYGTPAMASEMVRLYREHGFRGRGTLAMGGHQDGIVSFGRTCDEAGWEMVRALRKALSLG